MARNSFPAEEPNQSARSDSDGESAERSYRGLLRAFFDALDADLGMLVARNGDGSLRLLSMWEREESDGLEVPESAVLDHALQSDRAVVHPPLSQNGGNTASTDGAWHLAAPVHGPDGVAGAIYARFSEPPKLETERLQWIADSYARIAALCMEGDPRITKMVGDATRDPLTGCLNYAGLIEVLSAEFARARRRDHDLSCCFIDLDGFKGVNDRFGHLEGNRVLAVVGETLKSDVREYDAVGRFGGDEFVIVLPETDERTARVVAERLRGNVRTAIEGMTAVRLDVSVGVARLGDEGYAEALLDAADRALGEAKRAGGARVTLGGSSNGDGEPPAPPTAVFKELLGEHELGEGSEWNRR